MLSIPVNPKQKELIKAALTGPETFILYGGAAAGGKSFGCCLVLWYLMRKYPNSRYFVARKHAKDLDRSTVATFFKVLDLVEGRIIKDYDKARFWRYNRQGGFILHLRNGARLDLLATEYEPTDPNFDRFGSIEFTGGWLEEAQETSRQAADVLTSRIGRHLNKELNIPAKLLLTCNPSKGWLYTDYYQPFIKNTLQKDKKVILATMQDNKKYLPPEYIERMNAIADPAIRERLTLGVWDWVEDENFLIPARLLSLAVETPAEKGPIRFGVDIALGGPKADNTVIQGVCGNIILDPVCIKTGDYGGDPAFYDDWLAAEIYRRIAAITPIETLEPQAIRIDISGVGDAIAQRLKHTYNLPIYPFRGSNPPLPRRGSNTKINNIRSQAYWELKEKFRLKKIHLQPNYNEELYQELINQKYLIKNDIIQLEDKGYIRKRLGKSPDYADSLSMAFFDLPEIIKNATMVQTAGYNNPQLKRRPQW